MESSGLYPSFDKLRRFMLVVASVLGLYVHGGIGLIATEVNLLGAKIPINDGRVLLVALLLVGTYATVRYCIYLADLLSRRREYVVAQGANEKASIAIFFDLFFPIAYALAFLAMGILGLVF